MTKTKTSRNGRPPAPKAGSPAQREMAAQIASRIMELETAIFRHEMAQVENGAEESDLAYWDGRRIVDEQEQHQTYKQAKEALRDKIRNYEAGYPALMPLARKLMKTQREQFDAQD